MSTLPRFRFRPFLVLALSSLAMLNPCAAQAQAQKKAVSSRVEFQTGDGVVIKGTMYPAQGDNKKEAVVILLHDFHKDKGGSSKKEGGWQELAIVLQQAGYPVLSFDFRGYGDSVELIKAKFWSPKNRHNASGLRSTLVRKKGDRISYKDFNASYFINLTSDVAAARAYLERRNDAKELNCSSIILIGAGDGATVGAAWMYNESRRRRDKSPPPLIPGTLRPAPRKTDTEAESKDLAGAIWLSISGNIGTKSYGGSLRKWTIEIGKRQGVPLAFLQGKSKDARSRTLAGQLLKDLKPQGVKGRPKAKGGRERDSMKLTGIKVFDTSLVGEKLLDAELGSLNWIKTHLGAVMEDRGNKELIERDNTKARFLYTMPNKDIPLYVRGLLPRVNKDFGEEVPIVDVDILTNR